MHSYVIHNIQHFYLKILLYLFFDVGQFNDCKEIWLHENINIISQSHIKIYKAASYKDN